MERTNRMLILALTVVLGLLLQVLFVFADMRDTPQKAVMNFAQACLGFNADCLQAYSCQASQKLIEDYTNLGVSRAAEMGYSLFFIKEKLYHPETQTLKQDFETARIKLTAMRKAPLRSFFTGRSSHIDMVFDLVWEKDGWKVCGNPFELIPQ